ncbi:MAG TPA: prepilin-type N-terminal cleavage/methylation domain-containing protein [bacterium]|nr:prepilin-type N-terminal cleavage/methylation domain-containing protein [bacterium]HPO10965.1 prepilin-type N-terminal cleavage/methylation domain-containing protein [bacterium]
MTNNKKGFTLIELLVVIAIIGILSTLSIMSLNSARKKSRDEKRVEDMKQLQRSLELYFNDNSKYPVVTAPLTLGTGQALVLCDAGFVASVADCPQNKVYMSLVPSNPTPGGSDYIYAVDTQGMTYSISYTLEEATRGISAGQHTMTPESIN